MKEGTKLSRASRWQNLNFAGIVDWAVDLQEFSEDDGCASGRCDDGDDRNGGLLYVEPDIYTDKKPVIECNPPCQLILPPFTLASPTTIKFPDMTTSLEVAWTETTKTTGTDGKMSTSSFISRVVQTTTLKIPPVTTTAIDLWNHNIPEGSSETLLWLTWSIIPPPFTITNDPNPENKTGVTHSAVTRTIYPPPWPYSFNTPTTTPIPTVTHGTSTLHSSVHVATQTGKPGPKCTSNCGHKCIIFCYTPCVPGVCPPGSLGGGDSDFWDPSDPNHPPGPPPGPPGGPPPAGGSGDACQPDVKMDTGLCSNGNYPIFDPVNMAVRCDIPADEIGDVMTECQREIDENLEQSKDDVGESDTCCAVAKSNVLDTVGLQIAAAAKAKSCPKNPDFRKNLPPKGKDCHSTFTCDFNLWPNVCANARSAIKKRGKTSLLTYSKAGGNQKHVNAPWYHQKYRSPRKIGQGLALRGCDVEEYPFANGDPIRDPDTEMWDEQRVLRLIPNKENTKHGNARRLLRCFNFQIIMTKFHCETKCLVHSILIALRDHLEHLGL
ncbi:hypothetical protein B0J13DRAFT_152964 [Dactylonectria estremocensis]|uniref:Uncharacterized protein n=1 Tax=Dactylonectria estremocensis TaxID=1079267 RepID=A0A9P9DQ56_9HYPO|nr:hypothetical protein B0J13DRAFT_152964 [Dactylonectria estremocensis]